MSKNGEINTLIKRLDLVPDQHALLKTLSALEPEGIKKPIRIAFINAHAFNLCCSDSDFRRHILESDYIFRDGSGMKILLKILGINPGLNLNGTDLIPKIIELYAGSDAALFGTQEPYLGRAGNIVQKMDVTPALMVDGFQDDIVYLESAKKRPVPLIILAMGMPKQERVASLLASNLDYPCLIICGGAILDFMGEKVTRAPAIFRRLGMEWLYRLAQEPRRLFRRYVIGNFVFLVRSIGLAMAPNRAN